jgi:hypothetical protein
LILGEARDVREGSGVGYILLIRRYRVTSGTTLPAMMAPSPTAAASSNKIFICPVSPLDFVNEVISVHLNVNAVQRTLTLFRRQGHRP